MGLDHTGLFGGSNTGSSRPIPSLSTKDGMRLRMRKRAEIPSASGAEPFLAPACARFGPFGSHISTFEFRRALTGGLFAGLLASSVGLPDLAHAAAEVIALNIKGVSLEELAEIDVYSAARRLEPIQGVPSAIFVLTNEDIRRSRARTIPEALRLVPGVQVARVNANKTTVTIRGVATNKLLVMIDGRSIYDPLFSGVFWEAQDVVLADVDRIEVIRGPGGSLWGANAVNGVINIITKHARDTQGGLVSVGAGTEEHAFGTARYGWQPGNDQNARVYMRSFERGTGFSPSGNAYDQSSQDRAGFRWDMDAGTRDTLRVSGDVYHARVGQRDSATVTQDVDHRGGNLLGRWNRKLSPTESLRLQFYYDHIELDNTALGEKRDTYDMEFQHDLSPTERQRLIWGLGFRDTRDSLRNGPLISMDPQQRADRTESAFVQDTITLSPDRWNLTLGTKYEHNAYSGNEWQPNVRLAWTPNAQQTLWASAARAIRIPSRLERDLVFGGNRLGDNEIPETVYAYELGYRQLMAKDFWYDVATFYNDYRDLLTLEQNFQFRNKMRAHTYGVEIATRWQATPAWRLDAAYTYMRMNLSVDASSIAQTQPGITERSNPHYYATLRSAYDIRPDLQFDATLRHVGELPALNVPAYTALDLGLGWFPTSDLELALVAQNLLDNHHPEQAVVANGNGTEVQRGYYVQLRWRF